MKTISEASKEVLRNSHSTIKWIWTIVMALAVEKAIETFIYCIDPMTGAEVIRDLQNFYIRDFLLFITFIFTIVRFYHGDCRYIDMTYLESWFKASDPESAPSPRSRFFDFYLLVLHAILFYALAASQRYFFYFFNIYASLLLINSIWLSTIYLRSSNKKNVRYPRNWAINNVVHLCFLAGLYFLTDGLAAPCAYIVFFSIAVSNSFFDYLTTWSYYFPEIKEA